jgi:hypothetical protein
MENETESSESCWVTPRWTAHLAWLKAEVWPQESSYVVQDPPPERICERCAALARKPAS